MKHYKKEILKEFVKRKWLLKNELKLNILKSIFQSLSIPNMKRIRVQLTLQRIERIRKSKRINKVCLVTGKKRGISTFFFLSRHMIKKFSNWNDLPNIKIKS